MQKKLIAAKSREINEKKRLIIFLFVNFPLSSRLFQLPGFSCDALWFGLVFFNRRFVVRSRRLLNRHIEIAVGRHGNIVVRSLDVLIVVGMCAEIVARVGRVDIRVRNVLNVLHNQNSPLRKI